MAITSRLSKPAPADRTLNDPSPGSTQSKNVKNSQTAT